MFISDSCKYACASLRLTPQLPSCLFAEPPLDSGGADEGDRPNRQANSEIDRVPTGQGKVREIWFFFKVREFCKMVREIRKSNKSQGILKSCLVYPSKTEQTDEKMT